jgi:uncharacterized protein YdcH (DUF465 family)
MGLIFSGFSPVGRGIKKAGRDISNSVSHVGDCLDHRIADTTNRLDNRIADTTNRLDNRIADTTNRLDNRIADTTNRLDNRLKDVTNKVNKRMKDVTERLDHRIKDTTDCLDHRIEDVVIRFDRHVSNIITIGFCLSSATVANWTTRDTLSPLMSAPLYLTLFVTAFWIFSFIQENSRTNLRPFYLAISFVLLVLFCQNDYITPCCDYLTAFSHEFVETCGDLYNILPDFVNRLVGGIASTWIQYIDHLATQCYSLFDYVHNHIIRSVIRCLDNKYAYERLSKRVQMIYRSPVKAFKSAYEMFWISIIVFVLIDRLFRISPRANKSGLVAKIP